MNDDQATGTLHPSERNASQALLLGVHSIMAGIVAAFFGLGAAGVGTAVGVRGIVAFTTTNKLVPSRSRFTPVPL